ncbi:MAG: phosphohydrolase [Bacteroidetes bacterium]|nr:phosphohydrolase [Bacteroidota bacterium]
MKFKEAELYILEKLKNELPSNLFYHSYSHVMDVLQAAITYAEMENISEYETTLLKTAVLYHDSGFIVQSKDHEMLGCDMVKAKLPEFDYTEEEINRVQGMIMATKIPQTPHNILEQIVCDSDLDYLGRDDFWEIGNMLYKELEIYGILNNQEDWNRLQLKFLSSHQYFTQSAINLRNDKKILHLNQIIEIVNTYTS